ncbi:MAG: hypothetical protein E7329_09705 [Clostridiales bacterium]|nr:hypothetical protein [Clostridiales bacterium]
MPEYELRRKDHSSAWIYKHGIDGAIRYCIGHTADEKIRLNVWRLMDVCLCDKQGQPIKFISEKGADLEGVVLLEDAPDHIGGVHGDEIGEEYMLFVDGRAYTFDHLPDVCLASEIRLAVRSVLTFADTPIPCMQRIKMLVFDEDGVHVRNEWTALQPLSIRSVRACMLSVNKNCITHYYDSHVQLFPAEVPKDHEKKSICVDRKMVDICYLGDIIARHWAGERGGDCSGYSTLLHDYGYRLKSYFNCYDHYEAQAGEVLAAENHFVITC